MNLCAPKSTPLFCVRQVYNRQKVTKKARHRTRCPAARHARRGVPVLLGAGGVVWQYVHVLSADARASCARPLRAFSAVTCDARHRERRRDPRIRASLHCVGVCSQRVLASAAGCRRNGAPCGAARVRRISPQEAAHDARPFAECTRTYIQRTPEHPRAPGGQDARKARHRGCVSLVIFLCKQRK